MKKWPVTLSTTEPFNYIGIVSVRMGNINSEVMEATIVENGHPVDLTGCDVSFQTVIGGYPVERDCQIVDSKNGIVEYIFDEYTMQKAGKQVAYIQIKKGSVSINTTQSFNYFVIQAISNTPGEMGSYWQSIFDLIHDMAEYVNAGKADFESWFESVREILSGIDPGGRLLLEILNARIDLQGDNHGSISERLLKDLNDMLDELSEQHYTVQSAELSMNTILKDDNFGANHDLTKINTVPNSSFQGSLIIAKVDGSPEIFNLVKVGEL